MKREPIDEQAAWHQYELRKSEWQLSHKEATPDEYQAAMRKIAEECGV